MTIIVGFSKKRQECQSNVQYMNMSVKYIINLSKFWYMEIAFIACIMYVLACMTIAAKRQ